MQAPAVRVLVSKRDSKRIHFLMVHNLTLFPYQAQLFSIQTILPACSSAICGQSLELCSFSARYQAIWYFFLQTLLSRSSAAHWVPHKSEWLIFMILPRICRGWQDWWGLFYKLWVRFFGFVNALFNKTPWRIELNTKRKMLPDLIFHWELLEQLS